MLLGGIGYLGENDQPFFFQECLAWGDSYRNLNEQIIGAPDKRE